MAEYSDSRAIHIPRTASTCTATGVRSGNENCSPTTAGRGMERPMTATTKRRGHQHHPRHTTRRRLDASSRGPAQCGPAGNAEDNTTSVGGETSIASTIDSRLGVANPCPSVPCTLGTRWPMRINQEENETIENRKETENNSRTIHDVIGNERTDNNVCKEDDVRQRLAQCSPDFPASLDESKDIEHNETSTDTTTSKKKKKKFSRSPRGGHSPEFSSAKSDSPEPEHAVARARGDGNSDDESANVEEDSELAELAKLRCPSERTEVQAEREARRRKRCADYPGLAFGCSIFSSDTMMKFSLIKNELQNIMGNQLKRVSIVHV